MPDGVAVDGKGMVYVADLGHGRVVAVEDGWTRQTVLPFYDLSGPTCVAVDSKGTVYVVSSISIRPAIASVEGGPPPQVELPFTGLQAPYSVAVGVNGTVYVADSGNDRVVALAAGSTSRSCCPSPA